MPTYDYVCDACGHKFELFQSIMAPHKRKCPECGKQKLRRLIGAGAAIVFKGSGFYQTDYRSDNYKKQAAADKPSSDSSGNASEGGKSSSKETSASGDKPASSGSESSSNKPSTAAESKSSGNKSSEGRSSRESSSSSSGKSSGSKGGKKR